MGAGHQEDRRADRLTVCGAQSTKRCSPTRAALDTSVILKWLQDTYRCEVVTFTADIGQGEELEPARAKAEAAGVKQIYIDDLREEFVRDFVYPMFRANAHLRRRISARNVDRAAADRQAADRDRARDRAPTRWRHGATGKGNDQVRFELGYYALEPDIQVIAPWREWDLTLAREAARIRRRSTAFRSR